MIEKLAEKCCKDKNIELFHAQVKAHQKAGNRYSYTTQLRVEAPSLLATASSEGWEFKDTVHEAFAKLSKELKH